MDRALERTVLEGTTDIHIRPARERTNIRYRLDGILHTFASITRDETSADHAVHEARASLAKLDVVLREHFGLTTFHSLADELMSLGDPEEK